MSRRVEKDKGAVLLTTLLIMSLMSALAVAMLGEIRMAILRTANITAHAQTDWYVKASEDFARGYIEQNFLSLSAIEKNVALRKPIESIFEFDGGLMALKVSDGTQCLPLSTMIPEVVVDDFGNIEETDEQRPTMARAFQNLLIDIGLTELDAEYLTAAVIDWQDPDQQISNGGAEDYTYLGLKPAYRTPNAPIYSVSELRAIRGMTEELWEVLLPFVCAGDPERAGVVNINTMRAEHLPLLSAILGPDEDDLAAQLLQRRPPEGYSDLESELAASGVDFAKVDFSNFVLEPAYLWIEVDVSFAEANRTILLEFKIDSDGLTRTYRHYGTEGRRPELEKDKGILEQVGF